MDSKLQKLFASTLMLFLFGVSAFACTCTYQGIKAKGFSGQVFHISFGKNLPDFNSPISRAIVRVLKRTDDGDKVVAEVVADESGRFSADIVPPGSYVLQVESTYFSSVYVNLKISSRSRTKKDEIIIALAPELTCCEGYAGVQKLT